MSDTDEFEENEETYAKNYDDSYGVRDGTLFVVDATPPMFENNPHEGTSYFLQCIKQYKEILKQKLAWNRQDWMGLVLYGTEKLDEHSDTKHLLTLQKLGLVSLNDLKEIMKIDEGGRWEYYKSIASSTVYPLHDALWHAARAFNNVTVTMPLRKVIVCTCQDNPPITDSSEKHRIREKVKSYSDIGLQLIVIGLSENWNHDLFYKDLEILSQNLDPDDYKKLSLKDIVHQIKLPSRNMAKLPWKIGEHVTIDVSLCNLTVKTEYLRKVNISKETNMPLISCSWLEKSNKDKTEEELEDEEDAEDERASSPVLDVDIQKYQTYGGRQIYFTLTEVKNLCAVREPGINLICIKPISYHPFYHFESPYFVVPLNTTNRGQKLLFAALLQKCDSRNLMIICSVTIRKHSAPQLYTMIPELEKGGFYLHKIPFRDNIRNINMPQFIYDDKNLPPVDSKSTEVNLFEQMIDKLSMEYNPDLFSNPMLQVQMQTIESLALEDLEQKKPPPDTTLPNIKEMREKLGDLLKEYDKIFIEDEEPPRKRAKRTDEAEEIVSESKEQIRKLVLNRQIQKFTIPKLKSIVKSLDLKTSGKKEEIISRLENYFN